MGNFINELEIGKNITLFVSNHDEKKLTLPAQIVSHLKDNISIISINCQEEGILNFDNVFISALYTDENGHPYIWNNCKVVYYRSNYVVQTQGESQKHNRRDSFRVGISHAAKMRLSGHSDSDVLIRDISLSGFSITDRGNRLNLSAGNHVDIKLNDLGFEISLSGILVRIDQQVDYTIYGFQIDRNDSSLASYINFKQQKQRQNNQKRRA